MNIRININLYRIKQDNTVIINDVRRMRSLYEVIIQTNIEYINTRY